MHYCERHDHFYTTQWWNTNPTPDRCRYCKRENLNRYYEEFNKSFEKPQKEKK